MRVPTLAPPSVVPASMPQVRRQAAGPEAFGAGLGRGIELAAGTAHQVWSAEMDRVNESRAFAGEVEFARAEAERTRALQEAKGGDAPKAFETLTEDLRKQRQAIAAKLGNNAQREAFNRRAEGRMLAWENRGSGHVAEQMRVFDAQQMEAATALELNQAKANRNDTDALLNGFNSLHQNLRAWMERQGLPAEERQRRELELGSAYVTSVVEAHIAAEDDLAAERTTKEWGAHLTERDKERISGKLQISSRKGQAMRLADEAFAKDLDPVAGRAWLIEQAGDDPDLRDMAMQRWEGHRSAQAQHATEDENKAYAEAFAILEDPARDYASLPADLLQRIEKRPDQKKDLMAFALRQDRGINEQEATAELVRLQILAFEDPEAFKAIDPNTLVGKLHKPDLMAITKAIHQARQGQPGKELKSIITKDQAIDDAIANAGIDPKKDPDLARFFRQMLSERLLRKEVSADDKDIATKITAEAARMLILEALPGKGTRPRTQAFRRSFDRLEALSEIERQELRQAALVAFGRDDTDALVRILDEQEADQQRATGAAAPGSPPASFAPTRLGLF